MNAKQQTAAALAVELIEGGVSRTGAYERVAAENDVTPRTVRKWIKDSGLIIGDGKDIPSAFKDFNTQQRQETGNALAELVTKTVAKWTRDLDRFDFYPPPREMKDLAIMFGVLTDKRRLEDGEVTDRTETSAVPAREIVEAKILDLAERRKARNLETVDD